jgi:hypothetical protein
MKTQGDTNRPHSVKAEFDPDFCATPLGGAVLVEQTLRGLGVRRAIEKHLPERAPQAKYSMLDGALALMAALIVGGKGIRAAEILRQDPLASEIFGLADVPSEATMYRVLCVLATSTCTIRRRVASASTRPSTPWPRLPRTSPWSCAIAW